MPPSMITVLKTVQKTCLILSTLLVKSIHIIFIFILALSCSSGGKFIFEFQVAYYLPRLWPLYLHLFILHSLLPPQHPLAHWNDNSSFGPSGFPQVNFSFISSFIIPAASNFFIWNQAMTNLLPPMNLHHHGDLLCKIGRASCRERV